MRPMLLVALLLTLSEFGGWWVVHGGENGVSQDAEGALRRLVEAAGRPRAPKFHSVYTYVNLVPQGRSIRPSSRPPDSLPLSPDQVKYQDEFRRRYEEEISDGHREFAIEAWCSTGLERLDIIEQFEDPIVRDVSAGVRHQTSLGRKGFSEYAVWWGKTQTRLPSISFSEQGSRSEFEAIDRLGNLTSEERFPIAALFMNARRVDGPPGYEVEVTPDEGKVQAFLATGGRPYGFQYAVAQDGTESLSFEFKLPGQGPSGKITYALTKPGVAYAVERVQMEADGKVTYLSTRSGEGPGGLPAEYSRVRYKDGERDETRFVVHSYDASGNFDDRSIFLPKFPENYRVVGLHLDGTVKPLQLRPGEVWTAEMARWTPGEAGGPSGRGLSIGRGIIWVALVGIAVAAILAVRVIRSRIGGVG